MAGQPQPVRLRLAPDETTVWDENPGSCVDMENLVPTQKGGYISCHSDIINPNANNGAFNDVLIISSSGVPIYGEVIPRIGNNTPRLLVGTKAKKVWELDPTGVNQWTDVSPAAFTAGSDGGGDYSFGAFGDYALFVSADGLPGQGGSVPYASLSGGAFAALTGSPPTGEILLTLNNQIILLNTSIAPDSWACSGQGIITSWGFDSATQANYGFLRSTPGPITAGIILRGQIIAFKENSMYALEYVGGDYTYSAKLITDQVGCPSRHGVVNIDNVLYFMSSNGFYRFDGSYPQAISNPILRFYRQHTIDYSFLSPHCQAFGDRKRGLVFWHIPYSISGDIIYSFAYNVYSGQWGKLIHLWNEGYTRPPTFNSEGMMGVIGNPSNGYDRFFEDPSVSAVTIGIADQGILIGQLRRVIYGEVPKYGTNSEILPEFSAHAKYSTGDAGSLDRDTTVVRVRPKIIDVTDRDYVDYTTNNSCHVGERNDLTHPYDIRGLKFLIQPTNATNEYALLLRKERKGFEYPEDYVVTATTTARLNFYVASSASFNIGVRVTYSDATVFDYVQAVTTTGSDGQIGSAQIDMSAQAGKTIPGVQSVKFLVTDAAGVIIFTLKRVQIQDNTNGVREDVYNGEIPIPVGIETVDITTSFYWSVRGGWNRYSWSVDYARFDGEYTGKMFMADVVLNGGCELMGMTSLASPQGAT